MCNELPFILMVKGEQDQKKTRKMGSENEERGIALELSSPYIYSLHTNVPRLPPWCLHRKDCLNKNNLCIFKPRIHHPDRLETTRTVTRRFNRLHKIGEPPQCLFCFQNRKWLTFLMYTRPVCVHRKRLKSSNLSRWLPQRWENASRVNYTDLNHQIIKIMFDYFRHCSRNAHQVRSEDSLTKGL